MSGHGVDEYDFTSIPKDQLISYIQTLLPENDVFKKASIDTLKYLWFNGGRVGTKKLALTTYGSEAMDRAEVASQIFPVKLPYNSFMLRKQSQQHLKCPYFLHFNGSPYVKIYDTRIATMILLYDSIEEYFDIMSENSD